MSHYKCNLIIPGAGKSGTSSLHSYLDVHPEICMSSMKEPHFFSIDARWEKGIQFYNNLFSSEKPQATVFGESSTTYFASESAIERIRETLEAPRFIILLRDPVERVISHYRWMYALGLENRMFLKAIEKSGYGFDPNVNVGGNYMSYLEFSLYSKWVARWQEVFGIDNVLILKTDDLKAAPFSVVNNCCSFLGINKFIWDLPTEQNRTEDVLAKSENQVSALIKRYIPLSTKRNLKAIAPALVNLWNTVSVRTHKIVPPRITEEERKEVANILSGELEYYLSLSHNSRVPPVSGMQT